MKKNFFASLVAGVFLLGGTALANATVLTFDDIVAPNNWGGIYHGFTMTNSGIYDSTGYWPAEAVSGKNILYNYNSRIGEFSNENDFDFVGAYFTADGRYGSSAEVVVNGLDLYGNLLRTTTLLLSNSPVFYTFNWDAINAITWDPVNPETVNVAIDNFTYNEQVPEPATMLLFGTGLAGLAGAGLRRKKRA